MIPSVMACSFSSAASILAAKAQPASLASNSAGTSIVPTPDVPGFNLLLGNNLTPHVIISALHQYTNVKVLSNPSLVVVDNQVATLTVGDQIPVTTGSANILNTATSSSNTVFNSINYENTGIILRVQPRVNFNGNVTLDVDQEISECKQLQRVGSEPDPDDFRPARQEFDRRRRRTDRPARRPHSG